MKTIYLVQRNLDFEEGKGPMVNDCAFSDLRDAEKYIFNKPGIQGRRANWAALGHGDWMIFTLKVYDSLEEAKP